MDGLDWIGRMTARESLSSGQVTTADTLVCALLALDRCVCVVVVGWGRERVSTNRVPGTRINVIMYILHPTHVYTR